MKKLILTLLVMLLVAPVFSQTSPVPPKTFQIHSEKRPFIKKADRARRKGKGHRHHIKRKMNDKSHFHENHKK